VKCEVLSVYMTSEYAMIVDNLHELEIKIVQCTYYEHHVNIRDLYDY